MSEARETVEVHATIEILSEEREREVVCEFTVYSLARGDRASCGVSLCVIIVVRAEKQYSRHAASLY